MNNVTETFQLEEKLLQRINENASKKDLSISAYLDQIMGSLSTLDLVPLKQGFALEKIRFYFSSKGILDQQTGPLVPRCSPEFIIGENYPPGCYNKYIINLSRGNNETEIYDFDDFHPIYDSAEEAKAQTYQILIRKGGSQWVPGTTSTTPSRTPTSSRKAHWPRCA